jgi:hypothetical protein
VTQELRQPCDEPQPADNARTFIRVWQEATSLAEVAKKMRANKDACRIRGYRYRKLGVPLKEFPPVIIEMHNWKELAKYAASLSPKAPKPEQGD